MASLIRYAAAELADRIKCPDTYVIRVRDKADLKQTHCDIIPTLINHIVINGDLFRG